MTWRERVGRLERHTVHLTGRREDEFGEALITAAAAEENVPTSSVEAVGDGSVISATEATINKHCDSLIAAQSAGFIRRGWQDSRG